MTTLPTINDLTPAMLSAAAAAVISLVFRFVPGAADWFNSLASTQKQLFMLGVTAAIALFIGLYTFAQDGFEASRLWSLLFTLYAALSANQVTYQFVKRTR
jgi:hypothetical protein